MFSSWANAEDLDDINAARAISALQGDATESATQALFFNPDMNDDDVPFIPDIDDLNNQDLIQQTAEAPLMPYSQLSNIEEISKNLINSRKNIVPTNDGGNIDITPLTRFCLPEESVRHENDTPWTWNTLMSDIMYNEDIVGLFDKDADPMTPTLSTPANNNK